MVTIRSNHPNTCNITLTLETSLWSKISERRGVLISGHHFSTQAAAEYPPAVRRRCMNRINRA